jgi:hypothetical protein
MTVLPLTVFNCCLAEPQWATRFPSCFLRPKPRAHHWGVALGDRVLNLDIYLTRTPEFRVPICFSCNRFVQCFRGNISAIRPSDGRAFDKEFLEVIFALQRSENRTREPGFKIDNFFRAVVELYLDKIASDVFCFGNRR